MAEAHHLSVPIDPHTRPETIGRLQLPDCFDEEQSSKPLNDQNDLLVTNPILRFPPEITSEIFIRCLPEPDHAGFHPEPSLDTAPLMFGRICSQWQVVAWSTPRLWRSLSLQLYQERLDLDAWMIQSWLARSAQYPLSLRFHCGDAEEDEGWESHSASVALDTIIPHSHRWEQIDFFLPMQDFGFLSAVICELPLLKRLKIGQTSYAGFWDEMPEETVDVFCNTPQLRDATLRGCDPSLFPLSWGQLVRLWAKDFFVGECLEILEQTVNLVECAFLPLAGLRDSDRCPTMRLSHLSDLKVSGAAVHIGKLLDCLTLPALEAIEVNGQEQDAWQNMNLLSLVTRSSCFLQNVLMNRTLFGRGQFADFLRHVPFLVDLTVGSYWSLDDFLLDLMAPGHGLLPLAPRLRNISFLGSSISMRTLVTMLASRWNTDNPIEREDGARYPMAFLQSCQINISGLCRLDGLEEVTQLQAMVEEGLIVHIEALDYILSET